MEPVVSGRHETGSKHGNTRSVMFSYQAFGFYLVELQAAEARLRSGHPLDPLKSSSSPDRLSVSVQDVSAPFELALPCALQLPLLEKHRKCPQQTRIFWPRCAGILPYSSTLRMVPSLSSWSDPQCIRTTRRHLHRGGGLLRLPISVGLQYDQVEASSS